MLNAVIPAYLKSFVTTNELDAGNRSKNALLKRISNEKMKMVVAFRFRNSMQVVNKHACFRGW